MKYDSAGGWVGRAIPIGAAVILSLLVLYPVVTLLLAAFYPEPPRALVLDPSRFTLDNVYRIVGDSATMAALKDTIIIALGGCLVAVALGVILAWLVERTDAPLRRLIDASAIIPLILPPFLGAMAWTLLGAPRIGIINVILRTLSIPWQVDVYGYTGIIWVMGLYYSTYAYLFARSAFANMDASLEEASAISGAGTWQTMRRVTVPLIAPVIASSTVLVFVMMAGTFSIPTILGARQRIDLLSSRVYKLMNFAPADVNGATVLAFFLIGMTLLGVFVQRWIVRRRSYVTVTGKATRPKRIPLGPWRYPLMLLALLYFCVAVVLPYLAFFQLAFRRHYTPTSLYELFRVDNLTLDNFVALFQHPVVPKALWNSVKLGIGTAVLGSILYFIVGYLIYRTRTPVRGYLDVVANLPVGLPGLVIGIAFLWSYIRLPLYGTIALLGLAYIASFFPKGLRSASSTLLQIHPELEEQSRIAGAGLGQTILRVVAPLSRQGLASTMAMLFIITLRELSISIFLYTGDTVTLAIAIWDLWEEGWRAAVGALAVVYSVFVLLFITVARRIFKVDIGAV